MCWAGGVGHVEWYSGRFPVFVHPGDPVAVRVSLPGDRDCLSGLGGAEPSERTVALADVVHVPGEHDLPLWSPGCAPAAHRPRRCTSLAMSKSQSRLSPALTLHSIGWMGARRTRGCSETPA